MFSLGALSWCADADAMASLAFRATAVRFGLSPTHDNFDLFRSRFAQASRWYHGQRFYRQREKLEDARLAGLRALGVTPTGDAVVTLNEIWDDTFSGTCTLRPGAEDALRALRKSGMALAIASNSDCGEFREVLARTGLDALVDATICSEEAGSCKPDPMIYYAALERLGKRASETLFVGTSTEVDLHGARIVGMPTVLLAARPNLPLAEAPEADHIITTLSEVATLVMRPAPAGDPRSRRRITSRPHLAAS